MFGNSHVPEWIVFVALGALLLGCGEDQETGMEEEKRLSAGTATLLGTEVQAWADLDDQGNVEAISVQLPLRAVEEAPVVEFDPNAPPPEEEAARLAMPQEVAGTTFVDHIEVAYVPAGHPPFPAYTVPHFDIHYYAISEEEQLAIDCLDETPIPEDRVPPGYVVGDPGPPPEGGCVPQMGRHALDVTGPELAPENPAPFTKTMVLGYYAGAMHFVEPMVAREFLLQRTDFALDVPRPPVLGRSMRYPTRFVATYDAAADAYVLTLTGFEEAN